MSPHLGLCVLQLIVVMVIAEGPRRCVFLCKLPSGGSLAEAAPFQKCRKFTCSCCCWGLAGDHMYSQRDARECLRRGGSAGDLSRGRDLSLCFFGVQKVGRGSSVAAPLAACLSLWWGEWSRHDPGGDNSLLLEFRWVGVWSCSLCVSEKAVEAYV